MPNSSKPTGHLIVYKRRSKLLARKAIDQSVILTPEPITIVHPFKVTGRQRLTTSRFHDKLDKMIQLGNFIGWDCKAFDQKDRKLLNKKCKEIGINRDQFRPWVWQQKKAGRVPKLVQGEEAVLEGSASGSWGNGDTGEDGEDAAV